MFPERVVGILNSLEKEVAQGRAYGLCTGQGSLEEQNQ